MPRVASLSMTRSQPMKGSHPCVSSWVNWGAIERPFPYAFTILLLIFPAFCHAQLDCVWDQPSITSVSPSTWVAGKTTTVTLTGNNLCWAYGWVTVDSGSVAISSDWNIDVDPQTTLYFDVKPDASDPAEMATFWIGPSDCNTDWAPCFIPVSITVQIVKCDIPNITEIKPSTWFAGKIYDNVVIKGTGFTTAAKATTDCPATPVSISAADGSSVPVSNVNVVSKTKITLTVAPPDDDPTEKATVTVGTAPNTATATAQIPAKHAGLRSILQIRMKRRSKEP